MTMTGRFRIAIMPMSTSARFHTVLICMPAPMKMRIMASMRKRIINSLAGTFFTM